MAKEAVSTTKKPTCFVLMPISDTSGYDSGHFGRVYEHLLKPAIIAAGYNPVRADDTVKTDYIVVGIIQKIVESEMVVCDISARNPNVMYELGIRHAFNKPVVLVKDKKTEKIFDIQGLRYAEYDETLRIDAVTKDTIKITNAISETAGSNSKDTNSIVHLAGIKTAEAPETQTISADTQLILSAISALEHRVDIIQREEQTQTQPRFRVSKNRLLCEGGGTFTVGEELTRSGQAVGIVESLNEKAQTATVRMANGDTYVFKAYSKFFDDLDPF